MTEFNYRKYMSLLENLEVEKIRNSQHYVAFLTTLVDYYNAQILSGYQSSFPGVSNRLWYAAGRAGSHVIGDVNTGRTVALEMFKILGDYSDQEAVAKAEKRYIELLNKAINVGVFEDIESKSWMQAQQLAAQKMRQDNEHLTNFVMWLKDELKKL